MKGAWEHFRRLPEHQHIQNVIVWSDGGPKHFKLTEGQFYFSCISRPHFRIVSYNFFASHHGQSGCDGAAASGKRRIRVIARDEKLVMDTAVKLVDAINTLKNTSATPVTIYDEEKRTYKTMDGITSGHMFISHGPGDITGFVHTTVNKPATPIQHYHVEGDVLLWNGEVVVAKHI